jgi:mono/diheme cytochrome c family protein
MPLFAVVSLHGEISDLRAETGAREEKKEWRISPRKAKQANPIVPDERSIEEGREIYEAECLECHGKTGKGDGPKAKELEKEVGDISNPHMWEQTDGSLFWKTTIGRRPMPSYKKLLSEDERWHAVNYIRTLAPKIDARRASN